MVNVLIFFTLLACPMTDGNVVSVCRQVTLPKIYHSVEECDRDHDDAMIEYAARDDVPKPVRLLPGACGPIGGTDL